jgi:hypothetical protein
MIWILFTIFLVWAIFLIVTDDFSWRPIIWKTLTNTDDGKITHTDAAITILIFLAVVCLYIGICL